MNTLPMVFITVLNMSFTASYIALAVLLVRLLLKRLPKIFSYALWSAVLIRLICPVSFTSAFTILTFLRPVTAQNPGGLAFIPHNIGLQSNPQVNLGIESLNHSINSFLPQAVPTNSVNPLQIDLLLFSLVWVSGFALLVLFSIKAHFKVLKTVTTATVVNGNIFETDQIDTPFVYGFLKPKIYVPIGISSNELPYIVAHEKVHIKRLDYLLKPLAYLVLLLHWFNPLMWLCFALMSKDMEMSCDESVLKLKGEVIKADYTAALLTLATNRRGIVPGNLLAFGKSNVQARIENVLSYQKPSWPVKTMALIGTAVLILLFSANPQSEALTEPNAPSDNIINTLLANKTPYVGNAVKDIALIDALPLPDGIVRSKVSLQTSSPPYGITITYTMRENAREPLNSTAFYQSSILLFCLIDNVEVINWQLVEPSNSSQRNPDYNFTYTRDMAEKFLGDDVRRYGNSPDTLQTLLNRLSSLSFKQNAVVLMPNDQRIANALEIIMSSPRASSNPQDYINAHQEEFNSILALDSEALPYLFAQFEKGGQTDLRGHIMERLCRSILGIEDIQYASQSPQDWYDTYKRSLQRMVTLNSPEFVQKHNPKGAILLSVHSNIHRK